MKKLLIILLFLSSCALNEPQKSKTYNIISREQKLKQVHLNIKVELYDVSQVPIKGVNIEASSNSDVDEDITDNYGIADLALSIYENESIDIRFHSEQIEWTKTIEKVPSGEREITFVFIKQTKGNVELREISY